MTYSHAFYRAWYGRHVFASSSDWFIGLFTTVVIGQSNYFGFGFTTLSKVKVATVKSFKRFEQETFVKAKLALETTALESLFGG